MDVNRKYVSGMQYLAKVLDTSSGMANCSHNRIISLIITNVTIYSILYSILMETRKQFIGINIIFRIEVNVNGFWSIYCLKAKNVLPNFK